MRGDGIRRLLEVELTNVEEKTENHGLSRRKGTF